MQLVAPFSVYVDNPLSHEGEVRLQVQLLLYYQSSPSRQTFSFYPGAIGLQGQKGEELEKGLQIEVSCLDIIE
jgi:hypothetical protein